MNRNTGSQNSGLIAWDGAASTPRDIRRYTDFGFTFEVTTAIPAGVDAVFAVQAHDPSVADSCLPGAARDIPEVLICRDPNAVADPTSQIRILGGTPAGSVCSATLPCRPAAFVSLVSVSGGTANVRATVVLSGPMV